MDERTLERRLKKVRLPGASALPYERKEDKKGRCEGHKVDFISVDGACPLCAVVKAKES